MPPADERFSRLLDLMSVPGRPGLYVLGSFAKRVTLYSQQVRALNLVEALCRTGALAPGSRVAVIGGGAAGLTAAAGAAVRGLEVSRLEKFSVPLRLQRQSQKRYLHPHIYDWPYEGSLDERTGLPLLDWGAGNADQVAREIEDGWEEVKGREGVKVTESFDLVGDIAIHPATRNRVSLNWNDRQGPHTANFEAVIIAVGFGLEADAEGKRSYWKDDWLDFNERKKWLVSGYGDGGLTDLIRLCVQDFRHEEIVEHFAKAHDLKEEREHLLRIEAEAEARHSPEEKREFLTEEYQKLKSDSLMNVLKERLRSDVTVVLNGKSPNIYGPESSILNRFVVSQLARLGRFEHRPGQAAPPVRGPDNKFLVTFEGGRKEEFNEVILRHGPRPALEEDFPAIWEACKGLRDKWDRMVPAADPTRKPMWGPGAFRRGETEADAFNLRGGPDPVRDPFAVAGDELTCVVVLPKAGPPGDGLVNFVRHSLARRRVAVEKQSGWRLPSEPIVVEVGAALESPAAYDRAVEALCRADIAVFDVTDYDAGTMLLLGVRSVARRGVTVPTIAAPLDSVQWTKLPFNLKELNPISYDSEGLDYNNPKHPITMIGSMIEMGISLARSLPQHYLDLPAFDAVRRLGPSLEDYRVITEQEQILILCSFHEDYIKRNWRLFLSIELATAFEQERPRLVRIIDIASPRLVSHRLYAEIRRNSLCLVDWTKWSANVFYELGVRLAVNAIGAVNIISRDSLPARGESPHHEALLRLFSPIVYDLNSPQGFGDKVRERYREVSLSPKSGGALAHDQTFSRVSKHIHLEQEPGGIPVYRELLDSVKAMIGEEQRMQGVRPVLFSQSRTLMKQVSQGAVERLFAAWYYLRQRHDPHTLPPDDERRQYYVSIGGMLSAILLDSREQRDVDLGVEIDDEIRELQKQTSGEA